MASGPPPRRGIILLAHGSRDPLWRQPIEAVAERIRASAPTVPVRCAYLELSAPDLPQAAIDLIADGVTSIEVVPLFLGTGKHARKDMPRLIEALRAAHPAVAFELQAPVGEDPRLIELIAHIALENR